MSASIHPSERGLPRERPTPVKEIACTSLVTAVVFFTLGGVIKVALLCIELWEACCARPIGTKKEPAAAGATETTPLLKDEPKEEAAVEVEA